MNKTIKRVAIIHDLYGIRNSKYDYAKGKKYF